MLPANDAILLDKTKPDEFQFIVNKNANLTAMNLLTVMLCDTDAMIMLIDSTQTKDRPDGLAWKLIEKLCTKFKLVDMIASAMKLTLKKNQDPEYIESKIASLETSYGCQIEDMLKIAAIVKAGGKHDAQTSFRQ
jgi:signal recognition particle receptor subunit beta